VIIKPRVRGFICTTAHPTGCAANVNQQIQCVRSRGVLTPGPRNALILGSSAGYGLASRIVAAFGSGAKTLGVCFEKPPTEKRTATAGYYNDQAFRRAAREAGLFATTLNADAFADETRDQAMAEIREHMGPIDLVVYSLASPVRKHPRTGELYRSAIKPMGEAFHVKSLNLDRGEVVEVDLEPATREEVDATVAVMGGEDWEYWMAALRDAGLLAPDCVAIAYTYIGSDLTWPIYWQATLGKAKEDLDRAAGAIQRDIGSKGGVAKVAVLKFVVTQASAAIPVVPLYGSLLLRVMREQGVGEDPIEHIDRLFRTQLYGSAEMRLDDAGRIRMDELELRDDIQSVVKQRWAQVTTDNLETLSDFERFRGEFLKIFGFGVEGVDYEADVDPRGLD
jgi:enoyl-[acyl-carrier protein] reductase/trans-2-enoyl-CoA reductase (NAD+)